MSLEVVSMAPFSQERSTDLFNPVSAPPVRIFGAHVSYLEPDLESWDMSWKFLLSKYVLGSLSPR